MIFAVDVDYRYDGSALAAGVAFSDWSAGTIETVITQAIPSVRAYQPGRFFERELPCILAAVEAYADPLEAIVIDGYVYLGQNRRDGLGAHLFRELNGRTPVIGVAKSKYRDTPLDNEVYRGRSKRPLYVTSIGIADDLARNHIKNMHGDNRIPTLLAAADRACRGVG